MCLEPHKNRKNDICKVCRDKTKIKKLCNVCNEPHRSRLYNSCCQCRKQQEYEKEKVENYTVCFGKYKGVLVKDLPTDYVEWCYLTIKKNNTSFNNKFVKALHYHFSI